MYAPELDPYCFPQSSVLKNKFGLRDQAKLDRREAMATARRLLSPPPEGAFDAVHYRTLHRHIFQDVYDWAGVYRTVRIAKGGNWFCFPEYIDAEVDRLLGSIPRMMTRSREDFTDRAATFLGELNAIHPFREGNGRTQIVFVRLIAARAGHAMTLSRIRPEAFLAAMIASFSGDTGPLREELDRLM